jgi:oligogalacturonide lyase
MPVQRGCGIVAVLGLTVALNGELRAGQEPAKEPPVKWIEPATGHRVVRLSREPGSSLYFHQNAYTATGDKLRSAPAAGNCGGGAAAPFPPFGVGGGSADCSR